MSYLCFLVGVLLSTYALCAAEEHCTVLTFPASVCGSTEVNTPMCNAVSALKYCTNITVTSSSDSHSVVLDVAELATSCTSTGDSVAVQLMVLLRPVVDMLAEKVIQSSARPIFAFTERLKWNRLAIIADVADSFFLHTAEELYEMASETSDFHLFQMRNSISEIEGMVDKVERLSLKIIVVSLLPSVASKLLCKAQERNLVWPEYAWIVHSADLSNASCVSDSYLEGVIIITQQINSSSFGGYFDTVCALKDISYSYKVDSCTEFGGFEVTDVLQWNGNSQILLANYVNNSLKVLNLSDTIPSDSPPQYTPIVFIALFYAGTTTCLIVVTVTLILYFYFRNEPAIKATTVSLSVLIFIGCYMIILYLYILNSSLLPMYHKLSDTLRNFLCFLRLWLNGVSYPMSLILSTLLVKLVRIYRIFHLHGKASKFTSSNLGLAMYVILLALPVAIICLVWSVNDPFKSSISYSVTDGMLVVADMCSSIHSIRWLLILFVYLFILTLLLVIFAFYTRKIELKHFNNAKQLKTLCYFLVVCGGVTIGTWYLTSTSQNITLPHTALQVGHYTIVFLCMGLLFFPKIFPVIKKRLLLRESPMPKSSTIGCTNMTAVLDNNIIA